MKKRLILVLVIVLFILGISRGEETDLLTLGDSPHRKQIGKVEQDRILETATNRRVTMEEIIANTPDTRVYIIGETHTSYDCHTFQRDFIRCLFQHYPRLVIGLEFFDRKDDPTLDRWRLGEISEEDLLLSTGWFARQSYHYGYTRMIMNLIRKHRIRVIGLNIPRQILRRVSRGGFQVLSDGEKSLFPTIDEPNPDHRFLIKRIFGAFAAQVPAWFERIYSSQKMWDVVMAESMIAALEKYPDHKGVIIAGNFHVIYRLGIPFRYRLSRENTPITTLVPSYIQEDPINGEGEENPMVRLMAKSLSPVAVFSRGIGDYVFSTSKANDDYFRKIGIKGEMRDGKFTVRKVTSGSAAEEYGIREDDIIETVMDGEITSIQDFELSMYRYFGKQELRFGIKRMGKIPSPSSKQDPDSAQSNER